MSLRLDLKRIIREGVIAFWRNKIVSFASVLVMVMSLFVLTSLLFLNASFDFSIKQLEERVDVNVYFFPEADEDQVIEFTNKVALIPEVEEVQYISREESLESFAVRHQNDELVQRSLEELGDNPLGASINVKAFNASQYEAIVESMESDLLAQNSQLIERINYRDNAELINRLDQFGGIARTIAYAVTLFFIIVAILVVLSTIRLSIYASKKEISVKRLVGAEHRYIKGPFLVMGALYGFIAGLITFISLFPITQWLGGFTSSFFGGMNIEVFFDINMLQVFVITLGFGIILGVISSSISIRKYLYV